METLHLELSWNWPHASLAYFHPHPFPSVNYDLEYNSFWCVLNLASERSTLKVVLGNHKLVIGVKGEGGLMDCAPSNFVGLLSPCTGSFLLLDCVSLFSPCLSSKSWNEPL